MKFLLRLSLLLCFWSLQLEAQATDTNQSAILQAVQFGPNDLILGTTGLVSGAHSSRNITVSNLLESLSALPNFQIHVPIQAVAPTNGIYTITNGQLVTVGLNLLPGANVTLSTNGSAITISTPNVPVQAVAPTNGIYTVTNGQSVSVGLNLQPGANITMATNNNIVTISSTGGSGQTSTNATFYLASATGFFNVYLTNGGTLLASISNGVINLNTNVIINGGLTINSGNNLDSISNLLVGGYATVVGPQTNQSAIYAPNYTTPTNVATIGYVPVATSAGASPSVAWQPSTAGTLPAGTNSGDMMAYHGGNWIVPPMGQYLFLGTSTNATATNLSSFATARTSLPLTNGYTVRINGDFEAAGATNSGAWTKVAIFRNDAGTVSLVQSNQLAGPTATWATNWNALYSISGTNIQFQGVGDAAETVNWHWQGWWELQTNATQTGGGGGSTLLTGLKVYYAMENVNDSTATGDTLVNNNTATFVAGKVNNCVNLLSASSQSLTRANDAGNQVGTSDYSFACWFKTTSAGSFLSPMCYGTRGTAGYRFEMNSGQMTARIDDGTHVDTVATVSAGYNDGNWHFACVTVSRTGNTILYVDGSVAQSIATTCTLTLNNSAGLSFGAGWNGNADEAGIWSRALTPTEAGKLYNGLGSAIGTTYPFTGL